MTVVHINERSCEHYRRHFDAYMDNELPAESRQVSCCMSVPAVIAPKFWRVAAG